MWPSTSFLRRPRNDGKDEIRQRLEAVAAARAKRALLQRVRDQATIERLGEFAPQ